MTSRQRCAGAFLLGAGFALGQPPFALWGLALAALLALFTLLPRDLTPRAAALTAWCFGTAYFAVSMHWIYQPFQVDAMTTGWMAPFAVALLAAGLALFWAAAFWIGARLNGGVVAIALLWSAAELARSYALTGFPWGLVGYVWATTPMAQWHAILGPHGMTLATLGGAAVLGHALRARRWIGVAVSAATGLGAFVAGWAMTPAPNLLTDRPIVRLIQPNAPQIQKWDPAFIPIFFRRQVDFTAQLPRPDLIVWPETAVPNLLHNADEALAVIARAAAGVPVVLGIQREALGRYYNTLITLDAAGALDQVYDKHHLVPFGEYMPLAPLFARFNILGLAARAEGGFSPGPGPRLIDLGRFGHALPLICYEAIFPQDVNAAPTRPAVLLQITNDAWFGTFAGPQQHLQQARLRAIEQGLPMIRVANTGISAVIDPAGRLVDALPLGRAGFLDVSVPPARPPTLYSRTGDVPALIAIIVLLVWQVALHRRRGH